MIMHTKYQGSRPCGFKQEDFFMFSLHKPMLKCDLWVGHFWPQELYLNTLDKGPLTTH